jgi:uncharacterized protein
VNAGACRSSDQLWELFVQRFIEFIVRHRQGVVAILCVITLGLASQMRNLQIVIDPTAMLPKDHPNVIGTNIAEALFGNKYVVVIGLGERGGGSALTPEVLASVQNLTRKLADIPGVKRHTILSVTAPKGKSIEGQEGSLLVSPLLEMPISAQSIAELRARLLKNPVYQGTLVSKDESLLTISLSVEVSKSGFRQVVDRVEALVALENKGTVVTSLSGTPVFFAAVERFSQRMAYLFPIALVLIGLLHFEAFRTIQGMILPLVTAVISVLWVMGLMGAMRMSLDAFNATTPILILAVAAGHAVQILKRYYEEFDRLSLDQPGEGAKSRNQQAVIVSLTKVAPVMITAGLVAAAGFFSLISFEILTIRTFGLITGLGILCALVLELTLIPALRAMLRPPAAQKTSAKSASKAPETQGRARIWDRISDQIIDLVIARPKTILLSFATLALLASTGLLFLNQENSTKSYFGDNLPVRQQDRVLNERLAGTNTLYVVFQGDRADRIKDPVVLESIAAAQRYIETLPEVGKTISIVDLIKQMNRAMNGGTAEHFKIPSTSNLASQYLLLYSMSGEPTDFDAYVDYEYRNANLVVWTRNDSSKYAEGIVKKIRDELSGKLPPGITIQVGGSVPQTSALSATLVRGKLMNILQMICVVFVAGALVFRSALAGLYLITPLIVTVLFNFGLMGLTGIPLNTPNSVSSAMAIGIGADYAIYLLFRVREELQRLGSMELALRETLRTAGKAVLYVASAVGLGYAVLMLSFNFYVHIWLGALIASSMLVSAITALTLVPTLLNWRPPQFLGQPADFKVLKPAQSTGLFLVVAMGIGGLTQVAQVHAADPGTAQAAGQANAHAIMERSYQSTRLTSSTSMASFRLLSASGQERVRKTFGAYKQTSEGQRSRRVVRFLAPSDVRNTASLMIENSQGEDEIWVYLPALKKARRVAGNSKKGSFVGTDLSYGDVIGHKPGDWTHRLAKEEGLDGVPCYVVESTPKTENVAAESGYSKRVTWVHKESYVPLRVDAWDLSAALLKTTVNSQLKLVDKSQGKWQAMQVQVKNLQTGHSTLLTLDQFDATSPVAEDLFSVRYLEKEE